MTIGIDPLDNALDNPVSAALQTRQANLVDGSARVLRFQTGVAPFIAFADEPTFADWEELRALVRADGPGAPTSIEVYGRVTPPTGWELVDYIPLVLLTGAAVTGEIEPEAVRLTAFDVPDMLELIAATRPGPFGPRTIEMGAYWGIRREGRLVAMSGERLKPPGYTEVSAVCTLPEVRGQGLAGRLVRHVVAGIEERGETPFLHAFHTNPAIALYERLGFTLRARPTITSVRPLRHNDKA